MSVDTLDATRSQESASSTGSPRISGSALPPAPELLVATGEGIARLTPEADAWRAGEVLSGNGAQCLALHPDGKTVYAGTLGSGVWKSPDRGRKWHRLDLPETDVFSVAVSPADGAVYAGTEPSRLFVSRDDGRSWSELTALQEIPSRPTWSFPPRPWTSHVRWIAPDPHDAGVLLVGIELGGLMRSEDGGRSWSDHRPGAQRDVHCLAWHPRAPGRAYEAGGGGAAWSHDGGRTWEAADAGRDRHYTWGLAVHPEDPDTWFLSANPGPMQAHYRQGNADAFIYRWRGGGPWQSLSGGLPQPLGSFPYALACTYGWLFAGLGDGRIYASRDDGDVWQPLTFSRAVLSSVTALLPLPPSEGDA